MGMMIIQKLKGSFHIAKKCLYGLRSKNTLFSTYRTLLLLLSAPLVDFYKAHHSEKRGVLWLASYAVRCDWPDTSSMWQICYTPDHIWKHVTVGGNNTTARIKVTPSCFVETFGHCYANLATWWRRHVCVCVCGGGGGVSNEGVDES